MSSSAADGDGPAPRGGTGPTGTGSASEDFVRSDHALAHLRPVTVGQGDAQVHERARRGGAGQRLPPRVVGTRHARRVPVGDRVGRGPDAVRVLQAVEDRDQAARSSPADRTPELLCLQCRRSARAQTDWCSMVLFFRGSAPGWVLAEPPFQDGRLASPLCPSRSAVSYIHRPVPERSLGDAGFRSRLSASPAWQSRIRWSSDADRIMRGRGTRSGPCRTWRRFGPNRPGRRS